MHQSTTAPPAPQGFPVVSHRLQLRAGAANQARRYRVPVAPVLAAIDNAWTASRGNRFATRRAGWMAVDALMQKGG